MVWHLIPILVGAIIGLGITAVVVVALLTVQMVRNYLRNKRTEKAIKNDAVILKTRLQSGKYRVVAGFLDGDDVKDCNVWESDTLDQDLSSLEDDEVIIVR